MNKLDKPPIWNNDEVICKITGFTGIVVGVTHWMNGCIRVSVQSKVLKDGLPQDYTFDIQQLTLVKQAPENKDGYVNVDPAAEKKPGGPRPNASRQADARR